MLTVSDLDRLTQDVQTAVLADYDGECTGCCDIVYPVLVAVLDRYNTHYTGKCGHYATPLGDGGRAYHVWIEVDGYRLDPTRGQFDQQPIFHSIPEVDGGDDPYAPFDATLDYLANINDWVAALPLYAGEIPALENIALHWAPL